MGTRIPKKGRLLLAGAYEHFAVVTNVPDTEANELLNCQRKRCGTAEWGDGVLRNELGARTFSSNKSGANAVWYRFNALAFNVKSALTEVGLPK